MNLVQRNCKWCKCQFLARSADVKRGWALYCSKSCKASHQEKRTGQHANYMYQQALSQTEVGWDGYKDMGP